MHYLPANAQHIGAREYQQDSFGFAELGDEEFLRHGGFLAVLCDGMGGMEHGDLASQTAVHTIIEAYTRKSAEESIPDALERAVREANQRVFELAQELGKAENVGTTVVAAVVFDESLYFASVGDSGLFHVSNGQLQTVNQPHVYANVLERAVAAGAISREQADQHPERDSLTSFVGIQSLEEIDRNTEPWPLRSGDTILLSSDGMFKTLEPHEILAATEGAHPRSWPQALVERTIEKEYPGQDNVTVLSVTLDPVGLLLQESTPAPSVFQGSPASPAPGTAAAGPAAKRSSYFLWIGLTLLILALVLGGLWYFQKLR